MVYEGRRRDEQDQPAVAGTFTSPVVVRRTDAFPDYPESMRRKKQDGEVEVEGVVAQDGRFIDLKVFRTSDPGFNENALKAAAKYEFQPATLDGKPVACLLRVEMTFMIH
jgi:TonB family protein